MEMSGHHHATVERALGTYRIGGWMAPRNMYLLLPGLNSDTLAIQPVASRSADGAIPSDPVEYSVKCCF
jgi:hypothetical protein